ncbi:MAG TPA: hypothetical protein VM096_14950 [Vicinamibacterales bacterium]|nr:hypothetical protein [Vicinamibacterales bacterium]
MSLDDRIRSTVDQAVAPLVQQLLKEAAADREEAVRAAKVQIFEEAEQASQTRVADAEARGRAQMEERIAQALADDRDKAAREIRKQLEAEGDKKMHDALEVAENRMRVALADGEAKAAADLKAAVADARVKEREIEMAGVSRLLESVRGLDGATSLSEVLDALALAAAREAARAAVVVLRNDRIQGWRMSGFGPRDSQPKSVDLPLADSGVIGLAVGAARAVTTKDSPSAGVGPGFETLPQDRMGLAVPVIVGGRVVAVVYADAVTTDGHERHVPSSWPELIEVLARHAGRCLEALTTQKTTPRIQAPGAAGAAGTSTPATPASPSAGDPTSALMQITDGVAAAARRTARLLVAEIRLFNEPAVNEGRRHGNLLSRLGPEIEKARAAYNEQVPAGVRAHADYFQQELIKTLAGGDAALLGNLI